MGKYSKVSSSTEWRSGGNVVLRLMEYLTPAVSFDTFLTVSNLFVLGVNNIGATGMLNNANALSLGTKSLKKRNMACLNSAPQAKKQRNFDSG